MNIIPKENTFFSEKQYFFSEICMEQLKSLEELSCSLPQLGNYRLFYVDFTTRESFYFKIILTNAPRHQQLIQAMYNNKRL